MQGIQVRKTKAGTVTYRAQVRLKGARHISATFNRKTDALRWKQSLETDIRHGRHFPSQESKKRTVSDLIQRFIQDTFSQRKSKSTPLQTLTWWENQIGHITLDQVTTALIKDHWDTLSYHPSERTKKPLSSRTLNCYLETFSAALSKGWREYGWLKENPAIKLKKKQLPKGRVRFLDTDELKRFLQEVYKSSNVYLKPAVLLALSTGGRKTEILSLKWTDIDLKNERITFRDTKNGETRSVAIRGETLECLKQHAMNYRFLSEYVFGARKYKWKQGLAKINLPWEDPKSAFEAVCTDAKITNFRWHDMRHCAASYLLASGASLAEVGKILGHKTPQMTWRYSHLVESKTDELVEKMTGAFIKNMA